MADDVSRPMPVTQFGGVPGLPHGQWPTVTTADGTPLYFNPSTVVTCDGVSVDPLGLLGWLGIYPCEVVVSTEAKEYHAVKSADFTSTHNRGG